MDSKEQAEMDRLLLLNHELQLQLAILRQPTLVAENERLNKQVRDLQEVIDFGSKHR